MASFKIVKVSELIDFIESNLYKNLKSLPITSHRAISQYHNPRASKEDVALILAIDNDEVIGYFGLLPDSINNHKVFWNSCWWSHPKKGKSISMLLFYKGLELCEKKMVLTDFTEHTKPLIEATKLFNLTTERKGIRAFLRFYSSELLPQRTPKFKHLKPLFKIADSILNFTIDKRSNLIKKELRFDRPNWQQVKNIDEKLQQFIDCQNKAELVRRNKEEFNWILKYPWVWENKFDHNNEKSRYYFSSYDNSFQYELFKYCPNERIQSFIMFQKRNGHISIPYLYFEAEPKRVIVEFIINYLLERKAKSFYTYNPELVSVFENEKSLFIKKIELKNHFAFSNSIDFIDPNKIKLQDGDGDVVFT